MLAVLHLRNVCKALRSCVYNDEVPEIYAYAQFIRTLKGARGGACALSVQGTVYVCVTWARAEDRCEICDSSNDIQVSKAST